MTRLHTQGQVRRALILAGLPAVLPGATAPETAEILAAVAMVESADFRYPGYANFDLLGDLDLVGQLASNGRHWGPSVSCFQIRTIIEETGTGTIRDKDRILFSLEAAAVVAAAIVTSQGLRAWSTYTTEAYKAYLPEFYPPPDDKYRIVSGDTFWGIDEKLVLTRGTMQLNNPGIEPNRLQIGQLLQLPYATRTVQPGQTLTLLMRTVGWVTWTGADIARVARFANLLDPNKIYPNQTLRVLKPSGRTINTALEA